MTHTFQPSPLGDRGSGYLWVQTRLVWIVPGQAGLHSEILSPQINIIVWDTKLNQVLKRLTLFKDVKPHKDCVYVCVCSRAWAHICAHIEACKWRWQISPSIMWTWGLNQGSQAQQKHFDLLHHLTGCSYFSCYRIKTDSLWYRILACHPLFLRLLLLLFPNLLWVHLWEGKCVSSPDQNYCSLFSGLH